MLTKLDAFEVSPVLVGAGSNTGTLAVKNAPESSELAAIHAQHLAREKEFAGVFAEARAGGDPARLRAIHASTVSRGKELEAGELRLKFPGYPVPMEFYRFLAFAKSHLGIDPPDGPRIVMVKEFPGEPSWLGVYTPRRTPRADPRRPERIRNASDHRARTGALKGSARGLGAF